MGLDKHVVLDITEHITEVHSIHLGFTINCFPYIDGWWAFIKRNVSSNQMVNILCDCDWKVGAPLWRHDSHDLCIVAPCCSYPSMIDVNVACN